jgi:hypothetical protein
VGGDGCLGRRETSTIERQGYISQGLARQRWGNHGKDCWDILQVVLVRTEGQTLLAHGPAISALDCWQGQEIPFGWGTGARTRGETGARFEMSLCSAGRDLARGWDGALEEIGSASATAFQGAVEGLWRYSVLFSSESGLENNGGGGCSG